MATLVVIKREPLYFFVLPLRKISRMLKSEANKKSHTEVRNTYIYSSKYEENCKINAVFTL